MEYKGYNISKDQYNMYSVKSKGRGTIPKNLFGSYTSLGDAKAAIDQHGTRQTEGKYEQKQSLV